MARSRPNFILLLALLAVALALGATHRAVACPHGGSGSEHMPCCDGMDGAAMHEPAVHHSFQAHFESGMPPGQFSGCTTSGHCTCGQLVRAVQVTVREFRPAFLARSPVPVWPGPPVAAGRMPPPQGPPDTGFADPPGRHTYLVSLRLRI